MSSPENSVTELLRELKAGAEGPPQEELVHRFLHRLEALARTRLGSRANREDAEDVALSAMRTFLTRVPRDQFPELVDRNGLWALLTAITLNKATNARRKQFAQRRDVRRQVSLDGLDIADADDAFLDSIFLEGNRLLERLLDPLCRQVAQLKMEGFSTAEIAPLIQRSEATVRRKLKLVRKQLEAELQVS